VTETHEQQVEATDAEKWLSVAAIVLFILFVLTRKLDWASFHVVVQAAGTGGSIIPQETAITGTAAWHAISTPLILCAAALIPINLFFMFSDDALDPLAPAIANTVVGALLFAASVYFVTNTDALLGGTAGRAVALKYEPTTGAYVGLAVAALLLLAALAQLRSRFVT
jgi:hypothetical protein